MPLQNASPPQQSTPLDVLLADLEQLWVSESLPQESIDTLYTPSPLPTETLPLPQVRMKTLKQQPLASTGLKKRYILAATAFIFAAGAAGQQVYSYTQAKEAKVASQQLRKAMYQNMESKVAAFRQEIEDGQHFMVQHSNPIEYTTQSGDTVKKLAKKFHVSPNTIIKNNERKKLKSDGIEPGTKLTILPVNGIAHPIAKNETIAEISKRYDVQVKEIIQTNNIENPHLLREKQKIIIPNATDLKLRPKKAIVAAPKKQSFNPFSRSTEARTTGRRLSWPAAGTLTSNYGWRWFRMHNGIDIAGPIGTPIKAAKEGRVVYSGWMGGYGYAIDIEHAGGVRTRYAHNSTLLVKPGEYVARGQHIAAMGSTGHSTGPHLHFEVHVNGSPVNPRSQF